MKYAVKYCGGCNPRYNRVEYVKKLEKKLQIKLRQPSFDEFYDVIFIVCGCHARCADIRGLQAARFIYVDEKDANIRTFCEMTEALRESSGREDK